MLEISGVTNNFFGTWMKILAKVQKLLIHLQPHHPTSPKKQPNLSKAFTSLSLQGLGGWHNVQRRLKHKENTDLDHPQ